MAFVYLLPQLVESKGEVKGQVGWAVDRRVPSLCRSGVEYQEREREREENQHITEPIEERVITVSARRLDSSSIYTLLHPLRLGASSGWIEAGLCQSCKVRDAVWPFCQLNGWRKGFWWGGRRRET